MSQPLTDAINALTTYANEITGQSDTTLSDAVESLVDGYGGGGGFKYQDFSGGNIQAIIGDGASYINTGVVLNPNGIFSIKFDPNNTKKTNWEYIFSIDKSTGGNDRICIQRSGATNTWNFVYKPLSDISFTPDGVATVFRGILPHQYDSRTDVSLQLFRGHYNGNFESQISKMIFYGFNVVNENNEYIIKIVPWKDENDVICVKNLVTGDIYYNAGTGTFGYIDANGITHN